MTCSASGFYPAAHRSSSLRTGADPLSGARVTLRPIIFWCHLVSGVIAGIVILIMSATGALLMYERQLNAWSDSAYHSIPPSPTAERLSIEAIALKVTAAQPGQALTAITINSDPTAPVVVAAGRRTFFADAYTGQVLGESGRGRMRRFLSSVREWHRYLAVTGENRPIARFITGWSNALFLFIVVSGAYIWLPRVWTRASVRAIALFNGRASGKARDFNWHNVIGVWCCVPLFFVVITAMPISFPWANALIFRAVGEAPPTPGPPGGAAEGARRGGPPRAAREGERPVRGEAPATPMHVGGIDALWSRATQQEEGWRTISLRVPTSPEGPAVFTIDRGDGGQPQLRSTLTLDRTGEVVRYESFASQTLGRRLRLLSRFTHTGEVLGLTGQTIAGIASAGGVVLVYTGLALAFRRCRAWIKRRAQGRALVAEGPARSTAA
jgi:uncharacterized iron-regulated membrane protein